MAHLLCITNPLWPGTASYLVSGKPTSQTATGAEFNQRLGVPVSDWTHPVAPTLNCWLKLWTVSVKCHLDWPNDDWNRVIRGLLSARHNIYFIIITTSTGSDYGQRWPLELGWEARHPFQWPCLICDMAESAKKSCGLGRTGIIRLQLRLKGSTKVNHRSLSTNLHFTILGYVDGVVDMKELWSDDR